MPGLYAATNELPAEIASPPGSGSQPGFIVRVAQAPEGTAIPNNFIRAIRQLNGTLTDSEGAPVPNEAYPGDNDDESYTLNVLDLERDAMPFEVVDASNEYIWAFWAPNYFPGIPGTGGHTTLFALEAVAFLELPAGPTTFGVSVATDRTDMNDDDSYQVFVGAVPRDFFALKVGEFQRNAPPFVGETHNENRWTVIAPEAGLYPFRIVYWQGGRGANLQLYTILDNEERVIVNDSSDARAIKAYTRVANPASDAPYVAEVSPIPGSAGNDPASEVSILLADGPVAVDDESITLIVDGQPVEATVERDGGRVLVSLQLDPERSDSETDVRLEFADASGQTHVREWAFSIVTAGGPEAPVTGQWDFDQRSLAATVGAPLEFLGGPEGLTAQLTEFGMTSEFGIPDINGEPAAVMRVPGDLTREIGYIMTHGIAPNGGGTLVNQFTLIMDVYIETSGPGAAALLQISSLDNTDDGDLFWQGNNFGQGTDGYIGRGTFTAGEWHRVAAAYDMAADPPVVVKYVDGIKQHEWTANHSLDNPRRALQPTAILFADGDQDERREMYVNSIQIRAGRLTDAQMAALGKPTARGIPPAIPPTNVTGQWDFDYGDLGATIGRPLTYLDGPGGLTESLTYFGVTGDENNPDVPLINGEPAGFMYVPGDLDSRIGYVMEHLIPPNGGGTRVNQFTLIMDVMVAAEGSFAAAMLQISSPDNTDDGDLFWQSNNFGQGTDGYIGTGIFTPGEWHRVVAAYDMAADPPRVTKYVDGEFQDEWTANQGLDNPRRALLPTAVLFADGDADERRAWWVNAIQIRSGALTRAQIESLGGPSASGIPVVLPITPPTESPQLTVSRSGADVVLSWPAEANGFVLESSTDFTDWSPVPGVTGNSASLPATDEARFFRLRQ